MRLLARRTAIALALTLLLAACGELTAPFRDRLAIATQEPPGPNAACMDALAIGTLAHHPDWGVALIGDDDVPIQVMWPHGWYGREFTAAADDPTNTGIGIEVMDGQGRVVFRTGERIGLGGGFGAGDAFFTCGESVEVDP